MSVEHYYWLVTGSRDGEHRTRDGSFALLVDRGVINRYGPAIF